MKEIFVTFLLAKWDIKTDGKASDARRPRATEGPEGGGALTHFTPDYEPRGETSKSIAKHNPDYVPGKCGCVMDQLPSITTLEIGCKMSSNCPFPSDEHFFLRVYSVLFENSRMNS